MSQPPRLSELLERFLKGLSNDEKQALQGFLEELLKVHGSSASPKEKLQMTATAVRRAKTLWPVLQAAWDLVKQHAWAERGDSWRWGLIGGAASLAVFGPQAVGVAALGGAIGLPLWIVFGAGAALAKTLIDDIKRSRS